MKNHTTVLLAKLCSLSLWSRISINGNVDAFERQPSFYAKGA
jgi:hypothetical protein